MTPYFFSKRYMEFLDQNYPSGSLDTMQMDLLPQTHAREVQHRALFASFPKRTFVLVADSTDASVMTLFPKLLMEYPSIICVLLRNTTATDPSHPRSLDMARFKDLDRSRFFFFNQPEDIAGLDLANGECVNKTAFPGAGDPNLNVKGGGFRDVWGAIQHSFHCYFWTGDENKGECKLPGQQWENGLWSSGYRIQSMPIVWIVLVSVLLVAFGEFL